MARKSSKEIAKVPNEEKALVVYDFEQDAGRGFEEADKDAYAIPFLSILQKMSPQCDEDSDAYVKGAKDGSFYNSATQEIFDGKQGIDLVPVYYQRAFVEWKPREEGGGFQGTHAPGDDIVKQNQDRDDRGRYLLENGNYLVDTRYHFCLLLRPGKVEPVVISLTSSQMKKSRNWMTKMQGIRLQGKNGEYTPPMYSHIYHATTVSEENDKGKWKGWKIELLRILTPKEMPIVSAAKAFREQVASGKVHAEAPQPDGPVTDEAF